MEPGGRAAFSLVEIVFLCSSMFCNTEEKVFENISKWRHNVRWWILLLSVFQKLAKIDK
jgi:hypothetical protein